MKQIEEKISELIREGESVKDAYDAKHSTDNERQVVFRRELRWASTAKTILKFLSEEHYNEFIRIENADYYPQAKLAMKTGVLESALDSIHLGLFGKVKYLFHAELFESIIDQAEALLQSGHHIPAAVLGRIVIEEWLRDEAERQGVPNHDTAKASLLNDELKKRDVVSVPKWRQIQSMLDVGNAAAHGKTTEYEANDVVRMLQYARDNCV